MAALTAVLIWGLRLVSRELRTPDSTGTTFLGRALCEKSGDPAGGGSPSFSRIAGALGAFALVATFIGASYWVLYQLFFGGDLKKLQDTGTYFLAGAALFFPYAFNQLSSIFRSS